MKTGVVFWPVLFGFGFTSDLFTDRAHHGTGSGGSLSCHFCPDVFRTPAIRKNHMLHHHQKFLFQCGLCTFHNMYRRDLAWHLREHHRKNLPDDVLVREFVHWPEDMRKIMCGKCNESEAHDNAVWMGVDPNNVSKLWLLSTFNEKSFVLVVFPRNFQTDQLALEFLFWF